MNKKNIIIIAVGVLAVMGLVFYGGMKLGGRDRVSENFKGSFSGSGQFNLQDSGMRGLNGQNAGTLNKTVGMNGGVSGEVIAKDDKSITVKLKDGGSKIVLYSEKTSVSKMATSSLSDILVGEQIMVVGSSGQDGSVSAESIQVR